MNNYEIENHIRSAVEAVTPDIYDKVVSAPIHKEIEDYTNFQAKNKKNPYRKIYGTIAAMAACLLFFFAGVNWSNGKVISIVDIDVNPSIEIQMNKKDQVVKVLALNEEGRQVLEGMDLEKVDINVASNAILGAMVKLGFINDINNAILVTVQSDIAGKSEELKEKISLDINQVLDQNSLNGIVLNQEKTEDEKLEAFAEKYNISYGKALFIYNMTLMDESLNMEELASMSIGQLTTLINGNTNIKMEDIAADKSAYIGIDKAGEIVLEARPGAVLKGVELKYGSDEVVYEVEILVDGMEYEYCIQAYTGEILSFEGEEQELNQEQNNGSSSGNSDSGNNSSGNSSNGGHHNRGSGSGHHQNSKGAQDSTWEDDDWYESDDWEDEDSDEDDQDDESDEYSGEDDDDDGDDDDDDRADDDEDD